MISHGSSFAMLGWNLRVTQILLLLPFRLSIRIKLDNDV